MKRLFGILIFTFICAVISAQTLVPFTETGSTWKYTPKQQSEFIQIRQGLTLNGDMVYFNNPIDGEILQRYQREDGTHIWTNRPYNTAGYDSLHFSIASGVIALYKDGVAVISDNLDGRYLKIADLPTIPTTIWDLTGINRTGWAEGKLVKFDASGNLIVGTSSESTGIGLTDLSATSPILYNNTTGVFSFSGETDPSVYSWAKQSTKPTYTWTDITSKPTFATVATSGAYSDLSGTPTIPSSIWSLTGVDRTGWVADKVLKFNSSGDLIVGTDNTSTSGTGIALTDLSAVSPLTYNNTTGVFGVASGFTVPTTTEKGHYDTAYGWGNHSGLYRPVVWVPSWTEVTAKPTFATVATSGSYTDLSNKPVIPTNTNQLTNGSGFITLGSLSSTATGLSYSSATGIFSLTSGYSIPTTTKQGQWDTSYGWGNHAGLYEPKLNNPAANGYILSSTTTGIRSWIANASMVYPGAGIPVSTGTAWGTSITNNSANWNTAYSNRITSLTNTGSSGAATLISNVLNIPNYTLAGLGFSVNDSVQALSGTSITWNLDNGRYATLSISGNTVITLLNVSVGSIGTIFITNPSTIYGLKFYGYNVELGPNIDYDTSGMLCSGGSKYDSFSFVYTGSKLIIHANYDYSTQSW